MFHRAWMAVVVAAAAVAVAVPAAAGGICHEPTEGRGTEVTMTAGCFSPSVVRVPAGAVVTFVNDEPVGHTVTGLGGKWGSFDELRKGDELRVRFRDDGIYPYLCLFHPGMIGVVAVGDANERALGRSAPLPVAQSGGDEPVLPKATAARAKQGFGGFPILAAAGAVLVAGLVLRRRRER